MQALKQGSRGKFCADCECKAGEDVFGQDDAQAPSGASNSIRNDGGHSMECFYCMYGGIFREVNHRAACSRSREILRRVERILRREEDENSKGESEQRFAKAAQPGGANPVRRRRRHQLKNQSERHAEAVLPASTDGTQPWPCAGARGSSVVNGSLVFTQQECRRRNTLTC